MTTASYLFTGIRDAEHEVGRSWTLTLEQTAPRIFTRRLGATRDSDELCPVAFRGLLHRRLTVGAQAVVDAALWALSVRRRNSDPSTAGGMMRWAMSSSTGLTFSYSVFNYVFDEASGPLPFLMEPEMRSNGSGDFRFHDAARDRCKESQCFPVRCFAQRMSFSILRKRAWLVLCRGR